MDLALIKKLLDINLSVQVPDVLLFESIDSTNAEALRQLKGAQFSKSSEISKVLIANFQTAGRGRRGRVWISPKDAGLYFSVIKKFELSPSCLQGLSLLIGLAVCQVVRRFGVDNAQLKWPNDILVESAKLAGILLEMYQSKGNCYVVLGIGLNLCLEHGDSKQINREVTDLSQLLGVFPQKELILVALIEEIENRLNVFSVEGFAAFQHEWNSLDEFLGRQVKVESGLETLAEGISRGVDASGALLVDTDGGEKRILGGELSPSLVLL
jgi:BirA family biotin operon repressor/biotin-[acetyl-CoA-carboxylase] ligase